jgi:hypothetical protein
VHVGAFHKPASSTRTAPSRVGFSFFLGSVRVLPASIWAQHTLKEADLLGNDIDRLFSRQRFGDRSAGFNRC